MHFDEFHGMERVLTVFTHAWGFEASEDCRGQRDFCRGAKVHNGLEWHITIPQHLSLEQLQQHRRQVLEATHSNYLLWNFLVRLLFPILHSLDKLIIPLHGSLNDAHYLARNRGREE